VTDTGARHAEVTRQVRGRSCQQVKTRRPKRSVVAGLSSSHPVTAALCRLINSYIDMCELGSAPIGLACRPPKRAHLVVVIGAGRQACSIIVAEQSPENTLAANNSRPLIAPSYIWCLYAQRWPLGSRLRILDCEPGWLCKARRPVSALRLKS